MSKNSILIGTIGALLLSAVGEAAQQRAALVIGNSAYRHVPKLKNPGNDAVDLTAALEKLGFEVETVLDADLATMERAADRFVRRLEPGAAAVFHYSGHGIQVEQENYLVPVDFKLMDQASIKYEAMSASKLHDRMAGSGSELNIVILDACRNNGFSLSRSSGSGLAAMNAAKGSFVAFSTAPGRTASDDPRGRNGLFTGHLLDGLSQAGLSLDDLFNLVRSKTYDASGGSQLPWTSSSVIGQFFFSPSGERRDLTYEPSRRPERVEATRDPRPARDPLPPSSTDGEAEERYTLLVARAGALSDSLGQLREAQRQRGLSLRGDMAAAEKQMQLSLGQAERKLANSDGVGAERNLKLAEKAIEKLEAFLGR